MSNLEEKSSSSSSYERFTIAYTESVRKSNFDESTEEESSRFSTTSESLETPTTQESFTSLFAEIDHMKDKEDFFGYEPVWRTLSMSDGPKLGGLAYFYCNSVFELFSFLMSHLLALTPDEPIPYLISLVDRCLKYRDDEGVDPPLLFDDRHINSVYTALDPMELGTISFSQYVAGMATLGLTHFDLLPNDLKRNNIVAKEVFIREAKRALLEQLDSTLGKNGQRDSTFSPQRVSLDENKGGTENAKGRIPSEEDNMTKKLYNGMEKPSENPKTHSLNEKPSPQIPEHLKSSSVSLKSSPLLVSKRSSPHTIAEEPN